MQISSRFCPILANILAHRREPDLIKYAHSNFSPFLHRTGIHSIQGVDDSLQLSFCRYFLFRVVILMPSAQLEVAIQACRKAGNFINRESLDLSAIEAREKAPFDFVSRVDTGAQERITSIIRQYFPKDSIVAEESGTIVNPGADGVWYVDPLDGTTNFLHGFPHYAVSIAYALKGRVMAAAVYDPVKDELFSAERSRGAFLNNARIRVSGRTDMSKALIGTGFPFRRNDNYETFLPKLERVARSCAGLRRAGSAALDLCYVACGRLDGYWEANLKSWDLAAGSLIVLEAGGLVTDLSAGEDYLATGGICVGTPKIFAPLLMKVTDANTGK